MPTTPPIDVESQPLFDVQLRALSEAGAGNGVSAPSDLALSAGTGDMDVDIAAGSAIHNSNEGTLGSSTTVTLSTGGTDDRWDTIAFDTGTASVVVHEGTAAANPSPPGLQADEVLLGVVYVAASTTALDASDIVDYRLLGGLADHDHSESNISAVPNAGLVNPSLTVAGNTVALGNSTSIAFGDLSGTLPTHASRHQDGGADELDVADLAGALGTADQVPLSDGSAVSWGTVPNAGLTNSAVTFNGNSASLGGTATLALRDLRVTTSVSAATTTNGEDTVFVDPSGTSGVTITLASADAAAGQTVTIQDVGGTASSNTITVDTEGTETYADGDSAKTITSDRGWLTVRWDGSNWVSDRYQQVDQLDATAVSTEEQNITKWRQPTSYTVFKHNGSVYGMDNQGNLQYSNADFATVVNNIIADNSTTNTTAPEGLLISIAAGDYTVSSTIHLEDGIRLIGEGMRSTRLKLADGANTNVIDYVSEAGEKRKFFAGLAHLKVDGNKNNNSSGHGFYSFGNSADIQDADDFHIEHVFFYNAPEDNFHAESVWGYQIDHCLFEYAAGDGLFVAVDSQVYVSNCFIAFNNSYGLRINANRSNLKGLNIYENGFQGLRLGKARYSTVSNIIANDNGQSSSGQAGVFLGAEGIEASNIVARSLNSTTQDRGLQIDGPDIEVSGAYLKTNEATDLLLQSNSDGVKVDGLWSSYTDSGVRTVLNGWGVNAGDPSTTGDWSGNGYEGAAVVDMTNNAKYVYRGGSWV